MIKYPTKSQSYQNKTINKSFSDRGMNLEDDLNKTNIYYRELDIANIHKKPTPISIVKVDYPSRSKAKIIEAYFKIPSTTDYNGIYKGYYIDFEAKETHSNTSFALKNIHPHQIEHMRDVHARGGISFLILRFVLKAETYMIRVDDLTEFVKIHERKSIPYEWIKLHADLIPYRLTPPVDYIKIVDQWLSKEL
jgi:recombination protein U